MANADAVIRATRAYLNVPFVHLGRSRAGVDCIGLHVLALRDLGHEVQDCEYYDRLPSADDLQTYIRKSCVEVDPTDDPGTYITTWIAQRGVPQHVALLTDRGMIHTWIAPNKVVEHPFDAYWRKRVVAYWNLI